MDLDVQRKFGELLMEVDVAKNWVHGLSWSPQCSSLAVCAHDSCVHVIEIGCDEIPTIDREPKCYTMKFPQLPQCAALFLDEERLVTVGFHDKPLLFNKKDGGKWAMEGELKVAEKGGAAGGSSVAKKMNMFGGGRDKAKPTYARVKTDIKPINQNKFSVSGMDQNLILFKV